MSGPVLVDTGPLVALLNRRDTNHAWAAEQFNRLSPPFLTCEAVLSEACFLLRRLPQGIQTLLEVLNRGFLSMSFHLDKELAPVTHLLARYATVPMSLADACLVRMSELHGSGVVIATDSDFRVYRKNRRQVIPTIMPDDL